MKIIISGGGIGGLTTALCALKFGHEVVVLERAMELGGVGAGIQVSPNAMKVFEALKLDERMAELGFTPESIEGRMGISGIHLFNIPLADAAVERWGSPYLHIHRADYISVLETALRERSPESIRLGHEVASYSQTATSVSVKLLDGSEMDSDVLIGADGIHSPIRSQMLSDEKPVFTGNVAWRAVVPIDKLGDYAPRPTACAWMGRGKHCVTYRLRGGTLANLVAVVERDDWVTESWTEKGTTEEALSDFEGWHPTITRVIEEADELYRWALFDRVPLKTWVDGRVAILGDAAHPMLPFMAQGAATAVEDAWVVAHKLSTYDTVNEALTAYQNARYERTSLIQANSRKNAKTFHKPTALSQIATYGPMWLVGKLAPTVIHKRQDYLYGYDVTEI